MPLRGPPAWRAAPGGAQSGNEEVLAGQDDGAAAKAVFGGIEGGAMASGLAGGSCTELRVSAVSGELRG